MSKATAVKIKPWVTAEELTEITKRMTASMAKLSAAADFAKHKTIAQQYPKTKFSLGSVWHMDGSCQSVTIVGSLTHPPVPAYPCVYWNRGSAKAVWVEPHSLHEPNHDEVEF